MNYNYTINDISSRCKVSKQSLYNLIKKNQSFINDNSTRRQRKVYYNQAAMDFFIAYYSAPSAEEAENPRQSNESREAEEQAEKSPLESSSADKPQEDLIKSLREEIDTLKTQLAALQKDLDDKEEERKELFRQNGALLLMLQQEKQEKMLLLPAPKKSFSDRMKSIFKGKAQE